MTRELVGRILFVILLPFRIISFIGIGAFFILRHCLIVFYGFAFLIISIPFVIFGYQLIAGVVSNLWHGV